jgi:tetratricopeptide (TPR) repeat protein
MDQKILFCVLLSVFAQYTSCAQAQNDQQKKSASPLTRFDAMKLAEAAAASSTQAAPAARPADKPSENQPAAAAGKPEVKEDPAVSEYITRGAALVNKSKWDDALIEFNKALELSKYNTAVRNWIGYVYLKKNDNNKAIEIYKEIIELDPDYFEAHNNLGQAYQNTADYENAEIEYTRALELKPAFVPSRFNLATVLENENKNEDALREFENVLKSDPNWTDCYLHIGNMARATKDFDKAMVYYNKALADLTKQGNKDPRAKAEILCPIALIDKDKGDTPKCKEGLEKVLDLDPGSYLANLNLGIISFEEKDFTTCVNFLSKALERNPYDAAVHYWLGRYYFKLDSLKSSIKQFSDCLKCDAFEHKFPDCQEWLDKAKQKQSTF